MPNRSTRTHIDNPDSKWIIPNTNYNLSHCGRFILKLDMVTPEDTTSLPQPLLNNLCRICLQIVQEKHLVNLEEGKM